MSEHHDFHLYVRDEQAKALRGEESVAICGDVRAAGNQVAAAITIPPELVACPRCSELLALEAQFHDDYEPTNWSEL